MGDLAVVGVTPYAIRHSYGVTVCQARDGCARETIPSVEVEDDKCNAVRRASGDIKSHPTLRTLSAIDCHRSAIDVAICRDVICDAIEVETCSANETSVPTCTASNQYK
jgi:hypothetical protein